MKNGTAALQNHQGYTSGYAAILRSHGVSFSEQGVWLVHGQPDYTDCWVICLSLTIRDAATVLNTALPIIKESNVPFMLIANRLQHNRINNHAYPAPLFGKPLQVFLYSPEEACGLARKLAEATHGFNGVYIPACIRLGSIVYATYSMANQAYGAEESLGLPFRFHADAPSSPFPPEMMWKERKYKRVLKKRYFPGKLIRSGPKGNILKAFDLFQWKWVFIKQANAWASEDLHGRQMRDRLLWQQHVANAAGEWVRTPEILDFIDQDGLSYLVTEYIDAPTLESLILSRDNEDGQLLLYLHEMLTFANNLHHLGYIHRDLTARNILIHHSHVYLTDFELAHPVGDATTPPYVSGSIGYMSPEQQRSEQPTIAQDVYTLGALLYFLLSGEHPKAVSRLDVTELENRLSRLDVPESLKKAIQHCLSPNPDHRPTIDWLIGTIEVSLPSPTWQRQHRRKQAWRQTWQKLVYSGILVLLAGLTVGILWLASEEPNSRDNDFTRNYLNRHLNPFRELAVPDDVRYLAGQRGDSLYFSTLTAGQLHIIHLPTGRASRRYLIGDPTLRSHLHGSNMVEANNFGIMLYDGNNRLIFEERPDGVLRSHRVPDLFTRAVLLSENAVALRKFKPGERDQYLYRFDLSRDTSLNENRVTDVVTDGGLVTGGLLDFDLNSGLGVYLTRYANRITVLDTQMRVLSTGHTVDTFHHYTLKSQTITGGSSTKITNAGPAYYVNKALAINGNILYVNSYVKADNETSNQFRKSNVIDIYCANPLESPSYIGSLRLPTENKSRIRNFRILNNTMAVLTPGKVRFYHLPIYTFKPDSNKT